MAEVMTTNMFRSCAHTAQGIMNELNKKMLLFVAKDERDVMRLVEILNSLWQRDGKTHMLDYMRKCRGRDGNTFSLEAVQCMGGSVFRYDKNGSGQVILVPQKDDAFPFCPARPHRNRNRSRPRIRISVGYHGGMIRFPLFLSGCFKHSCKNKNSSQQQFLLQVAPKMPDPYVAPVVLRNMTYFVSNHLVGNGVQVIYVEEDTEDNSKGEETHIVHQGKGLEHYTKGSLIHVYARKVHCFLPREGYLVFQAIDDVWFFCKAGTQGRGTGHVIACLDYPMLLLYIKSADLCCKEVFKALQHGDDKC